MTNPKERGTSINYFQSKFLHQCPHEGHMNAHMSIGVVWQDPIQRPQEDTLSLCTESQLKILSYHNALA